MNGTSYWLTIIPLAAGGLAWLLNQFSSLLTLHLADRRTLRETLYFLLELRHHLRVAQRLCNAPRVSQLLFAALAQRLPGLKLTPSQHRPVAVADVQQGLGAAPGPHRAAVRASKVLPRCLGGGQRKGDNRTGHTL